MECDELTPHLVRYRGYAGEGAVGQPTTLTDQQRVEARLVMSQSRGCRLGKGDGESRRQQLPHPTTFSTPSWRTRSTSSRYLRTTPRVASAVAGSSRSAPRTMGA